MALAICRTGTGENERTGQIGVGIIACLPGKPRHAIIQNPSNLPESTIFRDSKMAKVELRGCSGFGAEGERDEMSRGFASDFEGRSSATGRESGGEDADRSPAQPRIQNVNSL